MKLQGPSKDLRAGFTLTELMVVVLIVALLALIAIPALSRDSAKSNYESFANELFQTLQRSKMEAISSRDPRRVVFASTTQYRLEAFIGGTSGLLRQVTLRQGLEVVGIKAAATGTDPVCYSTFPFEIQFSAISDVSLVGGSLSCGATCGGLACTSAIPCPCSATIYLRSTDDRYKGRIVIYQSTGYIRLMEGW